MPVETFYKIAQVVEAIQWTGYNDEEVATWLRHQGWDAYKTIPAPMTAQPNLVVTHVAKPNDFKGFRVQKNWWISTDQGYGKQLTCSNTVSNRLLPKTLVDALPKTILESVTRGTD